MPTSRETNLKLGDYPMPEGRGFTGILVSLIALTLSAASHVGPEGAYPPPTIRGAVDPAVTQVNIHQTICVSGYTATVRSVSEADKKFVLHRDGIKGNAEVDHLISLELAGSNDRDNNLWAEPYSGPAVGKYGARVKDVVETSLKRQICSGKMTLKDAQVCITTDWVACGRRIGAIK